jgi:hypothetical protein
MGFIEPRFGLDDGVYDRYAFADARDDRSRVAFTICCQPLKKRIDRGITPIARPSGHEKV